MTRFEVKDTNKLVARLVIAGGGLKKGHVLLFALIYDFQIC